ncbi:MAG TPA: DnaJ family domain-containing protein [Spirillospora sp.]|nr:DnaJ family domain-containing protein [Spirillospora sp.]
MARDWKSIVDQILDEARASGKFDDLPGNGRPLRLDEDPYTPDDLKLAHKILKDHDLAPDWMLLGKDVDALCERLRSNMEKGLRAYQEALADADRSATPFERRQRAEATWRRAKEAFHAAAARLNREILRYNLKVPSGIPQKPLFRVEQELERLANPKK